MPIFRKKAVEIEAKLLTIESQEEIIRWMQEAGQESMSFSMPPMRAVTGITIQTLEGDLHGSYGDWIIKGIVGEFYPCKPDIFEKTYERVSS